MSGFWREVWGRIADPTGETRELRRLRAQVSAVTDLVDAAESGDAGHSQWTGFGVVHSVTTTELRAALAGGPAGEKPR